MAKTVLCFGDSNTYGTPPLTDLEDSRRFPPGTRWPTVMAAELGPDWHLVEEGLPARTTVHDDPLEGAHKNGLRVLPALIESHRPIDVLIIMLGTNDLKARFGLPASDIATGAFRLVECARSIPSLAGLQQPEIVLVAPPPIRRTGCLIEMFEGGHEKSERFGAVYCAAARSLAVRFVDAGQVVRSSDVEGVHWEADQHAIFGRHMAGVVGAI
jgi:lysophospholipase L1-like esterase